MPTFLQIWSTLPQFTSTKIKLFTKDSCKKGWYSPCRGISLENQSPSHIWIGNSSWYWYCSVSWLCLMGKCQKHIRINSETMQTTSESYLVITLNTDLQVTPKFLDKVTFDIPTWKRCTSYILRYQYNSSDIAFALKTNKLSTFICSHLWALLSKYLIKTIIFWP